MIYDRQVNYIPEYGTCMTYITSSGTETEDEKISISKNLSTFYKLPGIMLS